MSHSKDLDTYMRLPYRIELIPDPEGWFVQIPELRGCMSQGNTPDDAVAMIKDAQRLWLQSALEDGTPIPEPRDESACSGKFNVRVPTHIHRDLVHAAQQQGVSLNLYVATALARASANTVTPSAAALVDRLESDTKLGLLEALAALHRDLTAFNHAGHPRADSPASARLLIRAKELRRRLATEGSRRGIKQEWVADAIADLDEQLTLLIDGSAQQVAMP